MVQHFVDIMVQYYYLDTIFLFLAPTGAQGDKMLSVRACVRVCVILCSRGFLKG